MLALSRIALRYYRDSVTVILTAFQTYLMSRAVTEQILTQSRCLVGVQRFKMAKIDPVSPFYPTLIGKGILQWENLQEVQKTSL